MPTAVRNLYVILAWVAIVLATVLVMSPGLKSDFFFDDYPNIVENPAVHIKDLSFSSLKDSIEGPSAGPLGRPLSILSFAVTHYFFGLDPFAFKAINLCLHIFNGILVSYLAALLFRTFQIRLVGTWGIWLPLWVGAVWVIHPINFIPVMLAVQRMTLLSGTFLLLALLAYLKAMLAWSEGRKKWIWLVASFLVFWPLSILSKETGLLFPGYAFAINFFFPLAQTNGYNHKKAIASLLALLLLVIATAALLYLGTGWLQSAYGMRTFTLQERLLTELRVLWFYAAQILIPTYDSFGLYHDDIKNSTSLVSPYTTIIAMAGWAVFLVLIAIFRRRQPLLCLAGSWFLIGHSLESTFLPLEIAHEYRNYLPSISLLLGAGMIGMRLLEKARLDYRKFSIGLTAAIPLIVLATFTWLRADQIRDPLVGAQIEANRHPLSARANYTAAQMLIQAGYGDKDDSLGAQQIRYYFEQAELLDSASKYGSLGLIVWACASGRAIEEKWLARLEQRLRKSPFSPKDKDLPTHLITPLVSMPSCLTRHQALGLFLAGAANPRIGKQLAAQFLTSAAEYELLVSADPGSARTLYASALELAPQDVDLQHKLDGFHSSGLATDHPN